MAIQSMDLLKFLIKESKTREGQGIVTIKTTGTNQNNVVVCTFRRQILIPFEGHAIEDKIEHY